MRGLSTPLRLCKNSERRCRRTVSKGRADQTIPIILRCPKAFTEWRMLNARIDSAASAFTALNPLGPDTRAARAPTVEIAATADRLQSGLCRPTASGPEA